MTTRMLAQKQPPFKKCVIAYWSSTLAPKMNGTKRITEATGALDWFPMRGRRAFHGRLKGDGNDTWTMWK